MKKRQKTVEREWKKRYEKNKRIELGRSEREGEKSGEIGMCFSEKGLQNE